MRGGRLCSNRPGVLHVHPQQRIAKATVTALLLRQCTVAKSETCDDPVSHFCGTARGIACTSPCVRCNLNFVVQ